MRNITATLASLADIANAEDARAESASCERMDAIIKAGNALLAAKARVKKEKKRWLDWVKANLKFTERKAQKYMLVAKADKDAAPAKRLASRKLSLAAVLREIAGTEKPQITFTGDESWYTPRDESSVIDFRSFLRELRARGYDTAYPAGLPPFAEQWFVALDKIPADRLPEFENCEGTGATLDC